MAQHATATRVVGFGWLVVLTAAFACSSAPQTSTSAALQATMATAAFSGDSTSDSALYQYARLQNYRLITDSGSVRTDSAGRGGALDLCTEQGSTGYSDAAMGDGFWRAVGCVIRSGPVVAQYPYLESGLSLILVRRSAGDWQARILGLSTIQYKPMFVSTTNTRSTLGSDSRRFTEGPRIYLCYTCDRKACCPQNLASMTNPTQAQADVEHIASIW